MSSLRLVRGSLPAASSFANTVRRVFEAAKVPVAFEDATVATAGKGQVVLGVGLTAQEQQFLKVQTGALTAVTSTRLGNLYPNTIYKDANVVVVASHINENEDLFDLTVESQRVALAGLNTKIVSGGLVNKFQKQREAIVAQAEAALQETINVAIAEARSFPDKQRTISVVFKDQGSETSPFDSLLLNALKKHLHNLGDAAKDITVDHVPTAAIYNKIIMFPETVRVVLTPPEYYGERVEGLVRGIGGGNGFVPVTFTNGKDTWVYTSHSSSNPIAPLLSATNALRNDAFKAANLADKIEKAIGKTLISTAPSDVPTGKANPEQFVEAVLKNL